MNSQIAAVVFLSTFASFSWGAPTSAPPPHIPADAVAALNALPEKSLTLPVVFKKAMADSDSYKMVQAATETFELPKLQSLAPFDFKTYIGYGKSDSRLEGANVLNPTSTQMDQTTFGISKYFSTGTLVGFDFAQVKNDIFYPPGSPLAGAFNYETRSKSSLVQNLWQDAFGIGARAGIEAGEKSAELQQSLYTADFENWSFGLIDSFYAAWLAKARVIVAESQVARKEKLVSVTRSKLERGTAESPDLIEAQSALVQARIDQAQKEQDVGDRWRQLLILLKYPQSWFAIDPRLVPMKLDSVLSEGEAVCGRRAEVFEKSKRVQRASLQKEVADLNLKKAKMESYPDLELRLSYLQNAFDPTRAESQSEYQTGANNAWTADVVLSVPLERSLEKAKLSQARADQIRAVAQATSERDQVEVTFINECLNLSRLKKTLEIATQNLDQQQKRWNQEENRFRLGRSTTFTVIQAGDDFGVAELQVKALEVEQRMSAWRLLQLSSEMQGRIQSWK